mmetsp:Transcript_18034/g.27601  ORF Transcript_18034/g.27601 Transcript_18034/m.27601 type:complete len:200 (+) Transcript_18034:11615-12214(+)
MGQTERADKFNMRRPAELIHRLHPIEDISGIAKRFGITRKGLRVAGHVGDPWYARLRQFGDLCSGTSTGRINNHSVKAGQFVRHQRSLKQVPNVGGHQLQPPRLSPACIQRTDHIRRTFIGINLGILSQRQRKGAASCKKVRDSFSPANNFHHQIGQDLLPMCRRLQERAGRRCNTGLAHLLHRGVPHPDYFVVPRQPS